MLKKIKILMTALALVFSSALFADPPEGNDGEFVCDPACTYFECEEVWCVVCNADGCYAWKWKEAHVST